MPTFVSFLRSVNVGGRKLPMAELRALYERHGHHDVVTYVQSGNVVSRTSVRRATAVEKTISTAIAADVGLEVAVLVRTPTELRHLLDSNPFLRGNRPTDPRGLHVTFLAERPSPALVRALDGTAFTPDEFSIDGREVYLSCPNGYGRTKINNSWFEHRLRVVATTRNWRTVTHLAELARA